MRGNINYNTIESRSIVSSNFANNFGDVSRSGTTRRLSLSAITAPFSVYILCYLMKLMQYVNNMIKKYKSVLSKVDGVNSLYNVVIGMTNRKDLLDDSLLPDEEGKQRICRILTHSIRENGFSDDKISMMALARTQNDSGDGLTGISMAGMQATPVIAGSKINLVIQQMKQVNKHHKFLSG